MIDKFLEFGGNVADAVTKLWTSTIQPFIEWFITNVAPVIAANLQAAIDTFFTFLEAVSGVIEALLTVLDGLIVSLGCSPEIGTLPGKELRKYFLVFGMLLKKLYPAQSKSYRA